MSTARSGGWRSSSVGPAPHRSHRSSLPLATPSPPARRNYGAVRSNAGRTDYRSLNADAKPLGDRTPNPELLEHERKRRIELRLLEWEDAQDFEARGVDAATVDMLRAARRTELEREVSAVWRECMSLCE